MNTLLRWAGGKRRYLKWITETVNIDFENVETVYEPFLGSGALFFNLEKRGVISDFNVDLVNFYRWVERDPTGLRNHIIRMMNGEEYYDVRARYNNAIESNRRSTRTQAARFYYLNRKGFNGIYRVNSSGLYNVPIGSPSDYVPTIEHFNNASELLRLSEIRSGNYLESIEGAVEGDLIYFDPPYYPDVSSKFNTYTDPVFGVDENIELLNVASRLKREGVLVIISNSAAPDLLRAIDHIPNLEYKIKETNRNINPKVSNRRRFKEIVIY